ncbi:hypothetical protein KO488_14905 [Poseidonibacter lekithochrous]|uniref:hypothetical protein n=1 Tax=Poseidonibacter TaxID=2321187 RepID=UPI001C09C1C3|nr:MULTISPECIES: hypothetical protein [Poseidonibacter]MBU3016044.1 hypothetical protein [Poseidonibacter lekithochrous]MDO6829343.1 hypothetical protein [Poseidonibacter sp. 1_MG-2023]
MKKKQGNNLGLVLLSLSIIVLFTSCTSIVKMGLGEGKEFTFDNKELESKMTFYCTDEKEGENIKLRARNAYDYFNNENDKNIDTLTEKMLKKEISSLEFAYEINKLSEKLVSDVNNKFNCTLIDVIDY